MGKPNHAMRHKSYYLGHGYRRGCFNARKGASTYSKYLAAEICHASHKPAHLAKLKRYLGRSL